MNLPPCGDFELHIPDADLDDLAARLDATRWPRDAAHTGDWRYGPPLDHVRRLTRLWRQHDWRATEKRLNTHRHTRVDCDGLVLHAMTAEPDTPAPDTPTVLLLHGWPSSFIETARLADELAHPAADAPPVRAVAASLPGYAPSDDLPAPGPNPHDTARRLAALLDALGHERVWIHAHDMSADHAVRLALSHPGRVLGYHTTEPGLPRADWSADQLDADERAYNDLSAYWDRSEGAYARLLGSRPASLAPALTDSPAGLAAWTFDKWRSWTVPDGGDWDWDGPLTDLLLDILTLHWCGGTVASQNRTYYIADTGYTGVARDEQLACPVGVALTSQAIERAPRRLAERLYPDIRTWTDLGTGGHFIAGERPDLLAQSIRSLIAATN